MAAPLINLPAIVTIASASLVPAISGCGHKERETGSGKAETGIRISIIFGLLRLVYLSWQPNNLSLQKPEAGIPLAAFLECGFDLEPNDYGIAGYWQNPTICIHLARGTCKSNNELCVDGHTRNQHKGAALGTVVGTWYHHF